MIDPISHDTARIAMVVPVAGTMMRNIARLYWQVAVAKPPRSVGGAMPVDAAGRMDLRLVFAANLRRLRHAKGLSQEQLAYEADVNRTYMSKLESGTRYVGLEVIGKLADALQVEPAELLKLPPKRRMRTD